LGVPGNESTSLGRKDKPALCPLPFALGYEGFEDPGAALRAASSGCETEAGREGA
jgi:hypothetical protein